MPLLVDVEPVEELLLALLQEGVINVNDLRVLANASDHQLGLIHLDSIRPADACTVGSQLDLVATNYFTSRVQRAASPRLPIQQGQLVGVVGVPKAVEGATEPSGMPDRLLQGDVGVEVLLQPPLQTLPVATPRSSLCTLSQVGP
ncbi:MAG: hypothetical protein ACK5XN_09890, partial [Bacteroidota bacterium]